MCKRSMKALLALLKRKPMEEKVKELINELKADSIVKPVVFRCNRNGEYDTHYITASPAALRLLAVELLQVSAQPLESEVEIDLAKPLGDESISTILCIELSEKLIVPASDELRKYDGGDMGCIAALVAIALVFISGLIKIYEMIF